MIFLIFNNKWATKIVSGLGNPNPGAGPVFTSVLYYYYYKDCI